MMNIERRRERHKINRAKYSQMARDYVAAYLSTHPCVDCGESDSAVLTFDHVRGEKSNDIASMVNTGESLESIMSEIQKNRNSLLQLSCYPHTRATAIESLEKSKWKQGAVNMSVPGQNKRSWIRRDRAQESYCRRCKTWKPKTKFDYRDVQRGLLHFECRDCRQNMRSWVRRDREDQSYCRTCKTWKPRNEFYYRDIEQGLLEYDCIECLKAYRRNSYVNHRETTRASNDGWTHRAVETAQEYIYEYLTTHPCVDCGNNNVLALTFDHVRGTKKGTLADMVARGRSIETIKDEIEGKCEVVCFNCHMRRERKRRTRLFDS